MNVSWEVEDGYCGGRPQHTEVPDDELLELEAIEEKKALIEEYVEADFEQNITWHFTNWDHTKEDIEQLTL